MLDKDHSQERSAPVVRGLTRSELDRVSLKFGRARTDTPHLLSAVLAANHDIVKIPKRTLMITQA